MAKDDKVHVRESTEQGKRGIYPIKNYTIEATKGDVLKTPWLAKHPAYH